MSLFKCGAFFACWGGYFEIFLGWTLNFQKRQPFCNRRYNIIEKNFLKEREENKTIKNKSIKTAMTRIFHRKKIEIN